MRGDFAVPTLFNGNFDAVSVPDTRPLFNKVPGWSFHFNDEADDINDLTIDKLVEWSQIPSLETYREQVGYDPNQPNYALKLDGEESVTHNRFIMPDWGALRFNVFAPQPADDSDFDSVIKVWLIDGNDEYELKTHPIDNETTPFNKDPDLLDLPGFEGAKINQDLPAVDLRRVSSDATDPLLMQSQRNRLYYGFAKNSLESDKYGETGFETFVVNAEDNNDIPEDIFGKSVALRFEVEGSTEVYLDDIFFQSNHLYLGNPTEAKYSSTTPDSKNFLLEMPGYSISYNSEKRTLNWASYQLNETWTGKFNASKSGLDFVKNYQLPNSFNQAKHSDYDDVYTRGHMVAAQDRTRNWKEQYFTYSTANILPQLKIKGNAEPWNDLEAYVQQLVASGNELYIIDGGYGTKTDLPPDSIFQTNGINVPERLWKVIVVMQPGQHISDLDKSTKIIAVDIPNDGAKRAKHGRNILFRLIS